MKTKTSSGLKVKAAIKAGGLKVNHASSGLRVKAAIRAGGVLRPNHSIRLLCVV